MNAPNCRCGNDHQGRLSASLTRQHRTAWRNALATLASPMVRLHQLRNVRTQMLHDALGNLDHCQPREPDA